VSFELIRVWDIWRIQDHFYLYRIWSTPRHIMRANKGNWITCEYDCTDTEGIKTLPTKGIAVPLVVFRTCSLKNTARLYAGTSRVVLRPSEVLTPGWRCLLKIVISFFHLDFDHSLFGKGRELEYVNWYTRLVGSTIWILISTEGWVFLIILSFFLTELCIKNASNLKIFLAGFGSYDQLRQIHSFRRYCYGSSKFLFIRLFVEDAQ